MKTGTRELQGKVVKSLGAGLKTGYQLREDTRCRVQYALPRLENLGLIKAYSESRWGPSIQRLGRRKKRLWGLTVKGFLTFLSQHRNTKTPILEAVEAYEEHLAYPEPSTGMDRSVLPVQHHDLFRRRIGDQNYVNCLTWPTLETDWPRSDVILQMARSAFKRRGTAIPPTAKNWFFQEQADLATSFTLRFLSNLFNDMIGPTSKAFRKPVEPVNHEVSVYVQKLFDQRIEMIDEQQQRLRLTREKVLGFFHPAHSSL
jgi:hypothetical protein